MITAPSWQLPHHTDDGATWYAILVNGVYCYQHTEREQALIEARLSAAEDPRSTYKVVRFHVPSGGDPREIASRLGVSAGQWPAEWTHVGCVMVPSSSQHPREPDATRPASNGVRNGLTALLVAVSCIAAALVYLIAHDDAERLAPPTAPATITTTSVTSSERQPASGTSTSESSTPSLSPPASTGSPTGQTSPSSITSAAVPSAPSTEQNPASSGGGDGR